VFVLSPLPVQVFPPVPAGQRHHLCHCTRSGRRWGCACRADRSAVFVLCFCFTLCITSCCAGAAAASLCLLSLLACLWLQACPPLPPSASAAGEMGRRWYEDGKYLKVIADGCSLLKPCSVNNSLPRKLANGSLNGAAISLLSAIPSQGKWLYVLSHPLFLLQCRLGILPLCSGVNLCCWGRCQSLQSHPLPPLLSGRCLCLCPRRRPTRLLTSSRVLSTWWRTSTLPHKSCA
jgi:hypothetical protein